MNSTTRLLTIVLANFIIVTATIYRLSISGIDIEHSRLIDNAADLSFMFDFVSFLILSFFINVGLLTYPSKKRTTFENIVKIIESRKQITSPQHKTHRKQSA